MTEQAHGDTAEALGNIPQYLRMELGTIILRCKVTKTDFQSIG